MADRREARKEKRHAQVREEILEATGRVLLHRGLPGLTLAAVARELELTKAALYYYFDSKEALVFEVVYRGLERHAEFVSGAVAAATSGAAALEAMLRAAAEYYGARKDELRLTYLVPQAGSAGMPQIRPEQLARIRPLNDLVFGRVAERIRADQDAGRVSPDVDPRRLTFVAHTAVLGMLTMEGLVEVAGSSPLMHSSGAMLGELVAAFVGRLAPPG